MEKQEVIFTFSNTHDAIRGEKTLLEGGLLVRTMALPDQIGAGCGICLRVDEPDREKAQTLLTNVDIQPQGVFLARRTAKGTQYTPLGPLGS